MVAQIIGPHHFPEWMRDTRKSLNVLGYCPY